MELDRVGQVLAGLTPQEPSIVSEVGLREHSAYLRMHVNAQPERWAVVHSSGGTWSSVEVDPSTLGVSGRFSLDSFHEDSPDVEIEKTLADYVDVAIAYLGGSGTLRRSPRLGLPRLVVELSDGSRVLRRTAIADIRGLLRPKRWLSPLN